MYNEESDEDEQLLKKEHKGMIYRRARSRSTQILNCSVAPSGNPKFEKLRTHLEETLYLRILTKVDREFLFLICLR